MSSKKWYNINEVNVNYFIMKLLAPLCISLQIILVVSVGLSIFLASKNIQSISKHKSYSFKCLWIANTPFFIEIFNVLYGGSMTFVFGVCRLRVYRFELRELRECGTELSIRPTILVMILCLFMFWIE